MKKSKGLFYLGIAGIVAVLVIAVVLITMGRNGGSGGAPSGSAGPTRITCYGGSEKEDFINDPEVKKILADKYGLEVNFIPKGSYKQVQIPPDELKSNKECRQVMTAIRCRTRTSGRGTSRRPHGRVRCGMPRSGRCIRWT